MVEKLLGLPTAASEHAHRIDIALGWVHVLMAVLFVGWAVYFVYVLARFRRGRSPQASYAGAKGTWSKAIEIGVVIFEGFLLIGLSMPLWAERVSAFPDTGDAVEVRVIGEQFAWNVHYPGADGVFGQTSPELIDVQANPLGLDRSDPNAQDDITTVNQLHLPVNKPAIIYVGSKDVIHSFALQEMRIKQDAVPGLSIPVWFVPTVTTEEIREIKRNPDYNYEISCAQLCGLGHYRMRGFMTIHTQGDYDAWLAEQAQYLSGDEGDDFWQ
jgi:cytochrome c oxidase subunit 2